MPDWFYKTVSQKILFRCRADVARYRNRCDGTTRKISGGSWLINQMGHMQPDAKLAVTFLETELQSRIGLGPWVDGKANGLPAWTNFGLDI